MAISRKRIVAQLRILLDKKKYIYQEGRLLAHLQNELNYTGRSSGGGNHIKVLIAEALEELSEQGIVTLEKSGEVYHGVRRTERKRARSTTPAKPAAQPAPQVEKPTTEVADTTRHAEPSVEFKDEAHPQPEPVQSEEVSTEEPTVDSTDEPTVTTKDEKPGKVLVRGLLGRIEELKTETKTLGEELDTERLAHAETIRQRTAIASAKSELEGQLRDERQHSGELIGELEQKLELAEAEATRLRDEAAAANQTLREGAESFARLTTRVRELEEANGVLTARVEEFESNDELDELAQRVMSAMS